MATDTPKPAPPPGPQAGGNPSAPQATPARSGLYWFQYHTRRAVEDLVRRHRTAFITGTIVGVAALFLLRALVHPLVLGARVHIYYLTLGLPLGSLLWLGLRNRHWGVKTAVIVALCAAVIGCAAADISLHRYVSLWVRWNSIQRIELKTLPVTGHERIQPQNSIVALANEAMSESETPTAPHFVRIGSQYRWTMGIEPAFYIRRLTRNVEAIFSVPGTDPSPSFSGENRVPVHFTTGEDLLLWHRTDLNVIRSFGIVRYLNFEPEEVKYVVDDGGEWVQVVSLTRWRGIFFPQPVFGGVQVVSLTRWKGIFFPQPVFGGVQVVRQSKEGGVAAYLHSLAFGLGEWIPPEKVKDYPYLQGQSLVSRQMSRRIAQSFRYQSGLLAPMPGYHLGDIRIPNMPGDVHDQPFTLYFQFDSPDIASGLYHYFALEPFQEDKQGLNTSVFIPADGTPRVYFYPHFRRQEGLTGVSAIAAKVMETRKHYDWSRNRPVEQRPFIRRIADKTRFFWMTTVVTLKDEKRGSFIAGTIPDVALTDAASRTVTWVDTLRPESWVPQAAKELGLVTHGDPATTATAAP